MKLKEARVNAGMTMKQVADYFGITTAAVANWESGQTNPLADKLLPLAKLYGVSVEELLRNDDEQGEQHGKN